MYVVMVAPECAPTAKAGGVGEVVSGGVLIAMRYGTAPVVRVTGGMADTVFDYDHSGRPQAQRNGYVFYHTDNQALESALSRAVRLWSARPREFSQLAANCMRADYSWVRPAQEYLDIYQHIRHK